MDWMTHGESERALKLSDYAFFRNHSTFYCKAPYVLSLKMIEYLTELIETNSNLDREELWERALAILNDKKFQDTAQDIAIKSGISIEVAIESLWKSEFKVNFKEFLDRPNNSLRNQTVNDLMGAFSVHFEWDMDWPMFISSSLKAFDGNHVWGIESTPPATNTIQNNIVWRIEEVPHTEAVSWAKKLDEPQLLEPISLPGTDRSLPHPPATAQGINSETAAKTVETLRSWSDHQINAWTSSPEKKRSVRILMKNGKLEFQGDTISDEQKKQINEQLIWIPLSAKLITQCRQENTTETIQRALKSQERLRARMIEVFCRVNNQKKENYRFVQGWVRLNGRMKKEDRFYFWWIILGTLTEIQRIAEGVLVTFDDSIKPLLEREAQEAANWQFDWTRRWQKAGDKWQKAAKGGNKIEAESKKTSIHISFSNGKLIFDGTELSWDQQDQIETIMFDSSIHEEFANQCAATNSTEVIKTATEKRNTTRSNIIWIFCKTYELNQDNYWFVKKWDKLEWKMTPKEDRFFFWWIILSIMTEIQKIAWDVKVAFDEQLKPVLEKNVHTAASGKFRWLISPKKDTWIPNQQRTKKELTWWETSALAPTTRPNATPLELIAELFGSPVIYRAYIPNCVRNNSREVLVAQAKEQNIRTILDNAIYRYCRVHQQQPESYNFLYKYLDYINPWIKKILLYYYFWIIIEVVNYIRQRTNSQERVSDVEARSEILQKAQRVLQEHVDAVSKWRTEVAPPQLTTYTEKHFSAYLIILWAIREGHLSNYPELWEILNGKQDSYSGSGLIEALNSAQRRFRKYPAEFRHILTVDEITPIDGQHLPAIYLNLKKLTTAYLKKAWKDVNEIWSWEEFTKVVRI